MLNLGELKMYSYNLANNELGIVFAKDKQEALETLKKAYSDAEIDERYTDINFLAGGEISDSVFCIYPK